MQRRRFLAATATATLTVSAGCTGLSSITGDSKNCSDSGIAIDDIDRDSDQRYTFSGTVTQINDDQRTFVVNDGTAKAIVAAPPMPSTGDCVVIEGEVGGCTGAGCEDDEYYMDPARILEGTE